ncbi:hypothetical protein BDV96DRAFT_588493 [Lophiotrema nucula]|uniref:Uncharacterized protein n=1 Tax=Lophiotrema nucula TaxID=690887 RepID=A0A6A5YKG6_9PLEO|nr:hypothetical protein BDV96DRAFT_588493 [Lophiotrema nucula]
MKRRPNTRGDGFTSHARRGHRSHLSPTAFLTCHNQKVAVSIMFVLRVLRLRLVCRYDAVPRCGNRPRASNTLPSSSISRAVNPNTRYTGTTFYMGIYARCITWPLQHAGTRRSMLGGCAGKRHSYSLELKADFNSVLDVDNISLRTCVSS